MDLAYSLNGLLFKQLGIIVEESKGVVDGLELKDPVSINWPDRHGLEVDLTRLRYKEREIRLDCAMVATSPDAFTTQLNSLITELIKVGTQRLSVAPIAGKPLVYEVYQVGGLAVEKKWRPGKMFGKFTLNFIEAQPVKQVMSGVAGSTATIVLSAISPITLHWGDGNHTDVQGVNQTITHAYGGSSGVLYYLIISGALERLTIQSTTNLTVVWPPLY